MLRYIVLALLALAAGGFVWLSATRVTAQDLPRLQTGDLVFQTSKSSQSAAILMASGSAYTHMGLVEIKPDGTVVVVEAAGPVRSTPIDQWIKRGAGGRIAIERMDRLGAEDAGKVLAAAHHYDGAPYDRYFLSTVDEIYCSELVRLAFMGGLGIEVGQLQKAKELNVDNMLAKKLIAKRWKQHPLCRNNASETLQSCTAKILEQELVTPVSIANDSRFKTIYSNYKLIPEKP